GKAGGEVAEDDGCGLSDCPATAAPSTAAGRRPPSGGGHRLSRAQPRQAADPPVPDVPGPAGAAAARDGDERAGVNAAWATPGPGSHLSYLSPTASPTGSPRARQAERPPPRETVPAGHHPLAMRAASSPRSPC